MTDHTSKKVTKKKTVTVRRLKNWFLSIAGLVVIILAISFTMIRVAIKSIPDYSAAIQQAVSEKMDITLEVGFLDAEIYWLIPRLNLFDVNVSDKTGKHHLLHLDEIDLSLDWAETIKVMTPVIGEITLVGLNVQIGVNEKSQLLIQNYIINEDIDEAITQSVESNVETNFEISEEVKQNFNNLNFKILNSQVRFYDDRHKQRSKTLTNFNLHLINSGESHLFEVKADLPKNYGKHAHFIIDVEGDLFDYKNLDGNLYLALESINAASWLDDYWSELKVSANADFSGQFWIEWNALEITEVNSHVNISDLAVHYLDETVNTWNVDHIDTRVRWYRDNGDWTLDVRDLIVDREEIDWLKPAAASLKMINSQKTVKLQADFLRVEGFAYLAGMLNSVVDLDITWLRMLDKFKPSGELENIDIQLPLDEPQDIKVNTRFSQLGFSLPETEPSEVVNLQGSISYLDNKTWLTIDSNNTEIKFNNLFRNSINLTEIKGAVELSHQNQLWELTSRSLIINTPHLESEMRLNFNMPDKGRPFLDLTMNFKNGNAKEVGLYLPAGVMGEKAVPWIDNALNEGTITHGGYQFYGYLDDVPFRESQGVSLADFNAAGVDLTYLKNWPDVKDISANLRFVNDTMFIKVDKARLLDSDIKNTTVYIDNFVSPTLDVKGKINVQLHDIKKFVNKSNLHKMVTDYIDNLQLDGEGVLDLELFLPLYGDFITEVGGKLLIENGVLKFEKEKYKLNNINGQIRFAGDTVESSGLKAEFVDGLPGQVIDLNIATTGEKNNLLYRIDVNGNMLASSLLAPVPSVKKYFNGSADWDVSIEINNNKIKRETGVVARIASDMKGVTTSLPGPLKKSSTDTMPIVIDVTVNPGFYTDFNLVFENGDNIGLKNRKNKILISTDTKSVKGDVDINTRDDIDVPIEIALEYLDLNGFINSSSIGETEKNNVTETEGSTFQESNSDLISPRDLPSFDFYAKKLVWKKSVYNNSVLVTQKSKLGAVIKNYKLSGNNHVISGKGSWFTGKNNLHTTKLDVNIKTDDLGEVFKELEITDSLIATSGNINLRWQWDDAPYNFDWKILQGDGVLNLKNGTLKELDAGAGRLFGLLNFKTLLSLDFGSQMKKGFNFDRVKGSFSFSDEKIYSDDFTIESKIADIYMKGSLSIANNTINQTVTVRPHVGASVTLGTAVVAGPAVGGIVYLFQKIFNTDRLSEYQYSMKGSIDNPNVELKSAPVTEQDEDFDF